MSAGTSSARGRPSGRVRVEARAKLNLGLAVGGARADGYHELATVFQSISLADTLLIEPRLRGFTRCLAHAGPARVRFSWTGSSGSPRRGSHGRSPDARFASRAWRAWDDAARCPSGVSA